MGDFRLTTHHLPFSQHIKLTFLFALSKKQELNGKGTF